MFILFLTLPILFVGAEIADPKCSTDGIIKQNWGYITVREGAEMFFWAYFTKNYTTRPLILWLQGGPGMSASGIGNFLEVGPKDMQGKERKYAWTNMSSVVFVDSPVGTGFSYVWDKSILVKTDVAAAKDLLAFFKSFYKRISNLSKAPLYVFGESYGGKVGVEFALQLTAAIKKKEIYCNFKGIALGDPWLSPVDSTKNYAKFLYANSLIDTEGVEPISSVAGLISSELEKNRTENATKVFFSLMEPIVIKETNGVNFYNILKDAGKEFGKNRDSDATKSKNYKKSPLLNLSNLKIEDDNLISDLTQFMNGDVKAKLRLPKNVTWSARNSLVFQELEADFMKSAVATVEKLLNETSLKIMIYNGQLDLIVPSIGSESWVRQLKWPGMAGWMKTKRQSLLSEKNSTVGYYKTFKNFSFYWILKAGHMVPFDTPSTAYNMLRAFLSEK